MSATPRAPSYEDVFAFTSLLRAFERARRAKRGRGGEPAFNFNLESELLALSQSLKGHSYRPDPYRYFTLRAPKLRIVSEASFRDRVVHHALVAALEPSLEARFVPTSFACRRGRGVHSAIRWAQDHCRRSSYFLRLDVSRYFDSIHHGTLLGLLKAVSPDPGIEWLCETLLEKAQAPGAMGPGRGLPIGNLTSQFWANVYLDGLDHLLAAMEGVDAHARYMDDVLVFARDKATLWRCHAAAQRHLLEARGLRLKAKATVVAPVTVGIPWLGTRIYRGLIRLRRPARARLCRRLRASVRRAARGDAAEAAEVPRAASLCGHGMIADTLTLRRRLLQELE